jgi:hypothetical protein
MVRSLERRSSSHQGLIFRDDDANRSVHFAMLRRQQIRWEVTLVTFGQ